MEILSRPIDTMRDRYSVVVIGSGYGGAIAADRIARAGRDVCILERGKELHPGEYPNSLLSAMRQIQVHTPKGDRGPATGMFDFRVGRDVTVLSGCGLGGTSLIDGNVALAPGDSVFSDDRWPHPFRTDPELLRPFLQAARDMLGSRPYPKDWPEPPKLRALGQLARTLGAEVSRPDINVTFQDGPNAAGVRQYACTLCGDCCSGCNYGAKNTVLMNYLPDAYWHGAHVFTQVAVRSVGRWDGKWRVAYDVLGAEPADSGAGPRYVTADVVVLAAGTLGSTEILLRSRNLGLPVSDRLGHGYSGNGDVLAFAHDTDASSGDVGFGGRILQKDTLAGPVVTGMLDLRGEVVDEAGPLIITEGTLPGKLAALLPIAMDVASYGDLTRQPGQAGRRLPELAEIPLGSYYGPADRTLTYLIMSTDDSGGQIVLENDRAHVVWPGVAGQPVFARNSVMLAAAASALHRTEIADPVWTWPNSRPMVNVHPLGGCAMADDAERGVVDHKGRVFDPVSGGVHDGLYVCDGSVIPVALDVSPLLTISAIAERTAWLMIEDRGWDRAQSEPEIAPAPPGRDSGRRGDVLGPDTELPPGGANGNQGGTETAGERPRRYLTAALPERVATGRRISLIVQVTITNRPRTAAELKPLDVPPEGRDITVTVTAPGLVSLGDLEQDVHVPADGDSEPVRFGFEAGRAGLHAVTVRAFSGGTFLAELGLEVSVEVGGASPEEGHPHAAVLDGLAAEPGEVTLQVSRTEDDRYSFQLIGEALYPVELTRRLAGDPAEVVGALAEELRAMAARRSPYATPELVRRRIRSLGAQLWADVVPETIRSQFWAQADRIRLFTIASDMDTVPWELLYPIDGSNDNGFLVEQFPVVRRVYGQGRTRRITLSSAACIVPPGSPANAMEEAQAVRQWLGAGIRHLEVCNNLETMMELLEACPSVMHFACHNTFTDKAGSVISLEGGPLRPGDLAPARQARSMAASSPLVFLNACRTAGESPGLMEMVGWAGQFMGAGAGAFIGSLWAVRSASAKAFAEEFYRSFIGDGQPLGKASLRARQAIAADGGDPTWLAYTVYGNPAAQAERGAVAGQEV